MILMAEDHEDIYFIGLEEMQLKGKLIGGIEKWVQNVYNDLCQYILFNSNSFVE